MRLVLTIHVHDLCVLVEGKAVLEYDVLPSGVLDYHHTEVPEACRGKGLAGILAKVSLHGILSWTLCMHGRNDALGGISHISRLATLLHFCLLSLIPVWLLLLLPRLTKQMK